MMSMRSVLLIILFFVTTSVIAQQPFIKELWLNENAAPVRVNDLCFASGRFLWLATDNGLYRYNGRSFMHISDTLKRPVTCVGEVSGSIWIGLRDGTAGRLRGNKIEWLNSAAVHPSSAITAIRGSEALMYLCTEDEGVYIMGGGISYHLNATTGLSDNFVYDACLVADELLLATDRGMNRVSLQNGKLTVKVMTTADGLPDNIVRVLRPAGKSRAWIGTQAGGWALYDASKKQLVSATQAEDWPWGQVNDILPSDSGECWVSTEDRHLLHVQTAPGPVTVSAYDCGLVKPGKLAADATGNIWMATNSGLAMSTANYAMTLRLPSPDYRFRELTAVAAAGDSAVFLAMGNALYQLVAAEPYGLKKLLQTQASISCVTVDAAGTIWLGTFGEGLYVYSQNTLKPVHGTSTIEGSHILSIARAGNKLWIASLNGVEEMQMNPSDLSHPVLVRHHNKASGIGSDYVYQLFADREGRVWMATDGGGVCRFDGKHYQTWKNEQGLTSDVVYALTEDAQGSIWAGTLEKGVFRFRNGSWKQFSKTQGIQNTNVFAVAANATGQVILAAEEGIDMWYPNSGTFRHFNRRLGVHIDSLLTSPNCIARTREGRVIVPYEHGLIWFENQPHTYSISPALQIDQVSLFNKRIDAQRHLFAHDENHISFRYTSSSFANPERLNYRYKLDNHDTNWTYTSDEAVSFVQLLPGSYTFHVQASLSADFSRAPEALYRFSITRPFWKTPGFIVAVLILLGGAIYAYITLRERNITKLALLQKERLIYEHEYLKSQVNPHFLFNSLNTLVNIIEENKEAAVDYTVHLSDLYRNMLSFKDQDLISLEDEFGIIDNYMYIQKTRFGEAISLQWDVPPQVMRTARIVPLALQMLIENALKHNIVSVVKPLNIRIFADEKNLTVTNPLQPKASKERGAGIGLANISMRYRLLGKDTVRYGEQSGAFVVVLPLM